MGFGLGFDSLHHVPAFLPKDRPGKLAFYASRCGVKRTSTASLTIERTARRGRSAAVKRVRLRQQPCSCSRRMATSVIEFVEALEDLKEDCEIARRSTLPEK